jgi:acyl-CoA thioester hydrolase
VTAEALIAPAQAHGRLFPAVVHFDDLDAGGLLHNGRYPVLVERAWGRLCEDLGIGYTGDWQTSGDFAYVVRELRISYEAPVSLPGTYGVDIWFERLGNTGLTYGFRFCSEDGAVTYAQGTRVLVHIDPVAGRPSPWGEGFKAACRELLRPRG